MRSVVGVMSRLRALRYTSRLNLSDIRDFEGEVVSIIRK